MLGKSYTYSFIIDKDHFICVIDEAGQISFYRKLEIINDEFQEIHAVYDREMTYSNRNVFLVLSKLSSILYAHISRYRPSYVYFRCRCDRRLRLFKSRLNRIGYYNVFVVDDLVLAVG